MKGLSAWFVILPLAARLLQADFLAPWIAGIELPFTWGMLFLAAALFFLALVIYTARCPTIIKSYRSWSDFVEREGSYERLVPLLVEVSRALPPASRQQLSARLRSQRTISFRDDAGGELPDARLKEALSSAGSIEKLFLRSSVSRENLADVYAAAREAAQRVRPVSRLTIISVQIAGLAILAWVACESALSVVEYYFPNL